MMTHTKSRLLDLLTTVCTAALLATVACSSPPAPKRVDTDPVASAGADVSVSLGTTVTLDGSASRDDDGDPLTYLWTQSGDNPTGFVLAALAVIEIAPDRPGVYVFSLTVSANGRDSEPDTIRVTASGSSNNAPVAAAGLDYALPEGSNFFLDGTSSSDPDGDTLSFLWEVVEAPSIVAIEDSSAAQTRFTPASAGSFLFRLTVNDGQSAHTDEVAIVVTSAGNLPPIAEAGSQQTVGIGLEVTFDGSGSSDPDGDPITYRWIVGNNPGEIVTLSDSTAVMPSFTPNLIGEYVFGLIVDDGQVESLLDTILIDVVNQIYSQRSGMIEIPTGSFLMGSETGPAGESPVHVADLSTFWIDSVEVTAAEYNLCVRDGDCAIPGEQSGCNYGLPGRADHPINCVDHAGAADFCEWASKRLPTEAEWEKSARGPNDQRRFPWGDADPTLLQLQDPTLRLLNYNNRVGSTTAVGQYPDGISPYGVHGLAGNVFEWVSDWYNSDYYSLSPLMDPQGPSSGEWRTARGGHFRALRDASTVSVRNRVKPESRDPILGFRCARSDAPP
ncbi:MAG: SUMF1/EgtB/PvdO family nonheme iron enzyme [Gemmatimonadetes bacterium]|nr:SUMF1/EgtB/PvdO family nonheme iron enzyme [Gemmatimonadota bacterium]MBT7859888.1 SUMF1/EgtB/PvdO family nonheme iron enzyme [Gemmatimonadota bacterium]